MKVVVTGKDHIFGPWLAQQTDGFWLPGQGHVIGLWEEGVGPVAACYYEGYNGAMVRGHLAGLGKKWMNREFLWYCFYYPFEQLGVKKIIGLVESDNLEARKLDEHLGFTLEATLKDAAPKGDHLIYSMVKDQCRWLSLKDRKNGKAEGSGSA